MKIHVLYNNQSVESIDFSQEQFLQEKDQPVTFLIGRSPECHIILDNLKISREHAELVLVNSIWKIRQKKESAELIVNGTQVKEKILEEGDTILIENFTLNFFLTPEEKIEHNNAITKENKEKDEDGHEQSLTGEESSKEHPPAAEESEDEREEGEEGEDILEGENIETKSEEEEVHEDFIIDNDSQEETDNSEESFENDIADETSFFSGFALHSLEIFGEHAPYNTYNLDKFETFIGRDHNKCHIVLTDPEVSSVHAVIKKAGSCVILEDLQSSNGTLLNGKLINKANLDNGSEFVIGLTTFTYKVVSEILKKEEERLMPVEENQSIEIEEIIEVNEGIDDISINQTNQTVSPALFSKDAFKDPNKRKKILVIATVLLALWVILDHDSSPPKPNKQTKKEKTEEETNRVVAQSEQEVKLTKEQKSILDQHYILAKAAIEQRKYEETLFELEKIFQYVDDWKESRQIEAVAKESLALIEEEERKRQAEEEKRRIAIQVQGLLKKAKKAVEERKEHLAEAIFGDILKLQPDNYEVVELKRELQFWKQEEEKKRLAEEAKRIARKKKEKALAPGKNFYNQKKWYKAILALEKFLRIEEMDEDLTLECKAMLKASRLELDKIVKPLLKSAESLREGQDLKGAYENYSKILLHNPGHETSLNKINGISTILEKRSRSVFIEGLIAENLSLFTKAKEKFQEVQQISPADSNYYEKASDRLKNYFEWSNSD